MSNENDNISLYMYNSIYDFYLISFKEIERFKTSEDPEQSVPAKNIIASVDALGNVDRNSGRPSTAPSDLSKFPKLPQLLLNNQDKESKQHREMALPFLDISALSRMSTLWKTKVASGGGRDKTKRTSAEQIRSKLKGENENLDEEATAKMEEDSVSGKVFISYQSSFKDRVLKIKRVLESHDISCWMAAEDMVGDVQDAIGEALMVAPAILICYSQSYRQSQCVRVHSFLLSLTL